MSKKEPIVFWDDITIKYDGGRRLYPGSERLQGSTVRDISDSDRDAESGRTSGEL